jgi:hypothetical protein
MTKHTGAPWTIDSKFSTHLEPCDIFAGGISIAVIRRNNYMEDADTEPEANARLIAAAPEMLEALKETEQWLVMSHGEPPADHREVTEHHRTIERIRAAIRKAEEGQ